MGAIDRRRDAYATIFGVAAIVVLYAVVHDQFIVWIAPEHFTVYHDPIGSIRHPHLLAATYGFFASLAPGLMLGAASLVAGRLGDRPPVPVKTILAGATAVVFASASVALAAGAVVWRSGEPFLPEALFPDESLPLLITQTIQLVFYAASATFSIAYLLWLHRRRNRLRQPAAGGGRNP